MYASLPENKIYIKAAKKYQIMEIEMKVERSEGLKLKSFLR